MQRGGRPADGRVHAGHGRGRVARKTRQHHGLVVAQRRVDGRLVRAARSYDVARHPDHLQALTERAKQDLPDGIRLGP